MENKLPPALVELIKTAKAIRDKKDRQHKRIRELEQLAIDAKHMGLSQSHRIIQAPEVFDYGNVIDNLCDALGYYEKHEQDSYQIE